MDLNELENKNIVKEKKPNSKPSNSVIASECVSEKSQQSVSQRRHDDWMLILKLSVILGVLVGILLGGVGGFFIGKAIYQDKTINTGNNTTNNSGTSNQDSIYSQFDYASMWINKNKGVSIESFYADDEERFFAMQLIGQKLPELKYLDSSEAERSIKDLGDGKYILEIVEPDCAYCNKMISIVDTYRETENSLKVLTLSIKDGDLAAFNTKGENAYHLVNKDDKTNDLVELIVWVPTFLYVENGEVKHVTFGLMDDAEEINKNIDIAFNQ